MPERTAALGPVAILPVQLQATTTAANGWHMIGRCPPARSPVTAIGRLQQTKRESRCLAQGLRPERRPYLSLTLDRSTLAPATRRHRPRWWRKRPLVGTGATQRISLILIHVQEVLIHPRTGREAMRNLILSLLLQFNTLTLLHCRQALTYPI